MLGYILAFYTVFSVILIIAYAQAHLVLHLLRMSFVFVASLSLIAITIYTNRWKLVSHFMLLIITLGVWTNLSVYVKDVNLATLQYIWFACVLSFYIHGSKWGWFYSVLNTLPALVVTIADSSNYYFFGAQTHPVTQPIYVFVIFYNFLLIVFYNISFSGLLIEILGGYNWLKVNLVC